MTSGPLTGVLIDGRYRVEEIVGAGGFGTVYAASHERLGGKVAIKVPIVDGIEASEVAEAIGRFVDEGRMLTRLRHPHIAGALDVGLLPRDDAGRTLPYLVLEWSSGPTLKEWLRERPGPIAPEEAWSILKPVFEAIAHAHQRGIAHRDIKPANILLEAAASGALRPRVIDFGIAKVVGGERQGTSGVTRTTSSRSVFTPTYAAPEQLLGLRTGPPTDVYALALVLLEMIGGKRVFASEEDARRNLVARAPPTPRDLGLDLGPWNEVIGRALSRAPRDRYPDAAAFVGALVAAPTRFLDDVPPPAPAVNRDEATARDFRLHKPADPVATAPPTTRTPPPSPKSAARRSAGKGALRALFPLGAAVAVVVGAVSLFAGLLVRDARTASGPEATASDATALAQPTAAPGATSTDTLATAATPIGTVAAPRPLHSLTGSEIARRARSAGMVGCRVTVEDENFREVRCDGGEITLADNRIETDVHRDRLRVVHALQALASSLDGEVRYAVGEGSGISFTGPPALVDDVAARVLEGIEHDGIQATRGIREPPVSRQLAEWSGSELVTRLAALGAAISKERRAADFTSVTFRLDGAYGVLVLEQTPPFPISSMVRPFVYAMAGNQLLTLRGDAPLVSEALLTRILGPTQVASRGAYRE